VADNCSRCGGKPRLSASNTGWDEHGMTEYWVWFCECSNCGRMGPPMRFSVQAEAAWNDRQKAIAVAYKANPPTVDAAEKP